MPKFSLTSAEVGIRTLISIREGSIGYQQGQPILQDITLSLGFGQRLALKGNNGSGKSTLAKAILGEAAVIKEGDWYGPKSQDIGYLDQLPRPAL